MAGIGIGLGLLIARFSNKQNKFEVIIDRNKKTFESKPDKLTLQMSEIKGVKVTNKQMDRGVVMTSPGVVIPAGNVFSSAIAIEQSNGDRLLSGTFMNFDDASKVVEAIKNALGLK